MNTKILQHKQRIDKLFQEVTTISDMRMQGEWAKYLCVLSSGYLENSLRILLSDYISRNSSREIQRYSEPIIGSLTNCKHGKIIKTLEQFDTNWASSFSEKIEKKSKIENEIKDSIDSLVQNRHDIAHGKSIGVGYVTVKKYYEKANEAVEIMEEIIR